MVINVHQGLGDAGLKARSSAIIVKIKSKLLAIEFEIEAAVRSIVFIGLSLVNTCFNKSVSLDHFLPKSVIFLN